MAKVGFSSENKSQSAYDFPKLSLKQNEKARIMCIEPEPEMEYVHTLRTPRLNDGEAVYETKTYRDQTREEMAFDFVGRYICLGSPETIAKKGADPAACPLCKAAEDDEAFDKPQRRFAMHVVKYRTSPGGFKVPEPFSADLVVWAFTDRVFNMLVDFHDDHGDLRKKDLNLGPCENATFQKFDINVSSGAEWLKSAERQAFIKRLYSENKVENLSQIIARTAKKDSITTDIDMVRSRLVQARGGSGGGDDLDFGSEVDLGNLLDDGPPAEPEEAPAARDESLDDLLSGDAEPEEETEEETAEPEVEETEEEPEPEPEKKAPAKKAAAKKAPAKKAAAKKAEPEPTPPADDEDVDFDKMFAEL